MIGRITFSFVIATLFWVQSAEAKIRALVIGVSDYTYLDADLRGPANDVGLVADMLMARGATAGDIRVLAAPEVRLPSGVSVFGQPTRAQILGRFDDLASASKSGDIVFVYYSGHGSQAPDQNGDEAGGVDEILLASDTKGWNGGTGLVDGAIVDDELAQKMQAILDTGAQVVAVLDACHSATGFRDMPQAALASRYVDPSSLGVPTDTLAQEASSSKPLTGDFVFLYSAQSDERAFETPIGDANDPQNWNGDFTRQLISTLLSSASMTWGQALESTMDGLKAVGPSRQTPDGEGSLLSAPVFGKVNAEGYFQYKDGMLNAGTLRGLSVGAIVGIYKPEQPEEKLAEVVLTSAGAMSSQFEMQEGLPEYGLAKLVSHGPMQPLRVGFAGKNQSWGDKLLSMLQTNEGLVRDDAQADVLVHFLSDGAAVSYPAGALDEGGPGSDLRLGSVMELSDALKRVASLHHMRRALVQAKGEEVGGFSLTLPGSDLDVSVSVGDAKGQCDRGVSLVSAREPVKVAHCDQLWLTVSNPSSDAQDVTVLYVNGDFSVSAVWPDDFTSNRIGSEERQRIGMLIQQDEKSASREEVLVLSVPAKPGARRVELTGLATDAQTRAGVSNKTLDWLDHAMDGDSATRAIGAGTPKITTKRIPIILKNRKDD